MSPLEPRDIHKPVLLKEVIERLDPQSGEAHVDCTVGLGGHAEAILARLGPGGLLIGIDRDSEALGLARPRLEAVGFPFQLKQGVYSRIQELLPSAGLPPQGAVDGLLLDLGVSSLQLDWAPRGFSFLRDGPLDMRMSAEEGEPASAFISRASVEELESILRDYGEEPAARRVARAIDKARQTAEIQTTGQLARIIESVLPRMGKRTHPATRAFQALRIHVNQELDHLERLLRDLDRVLKPGGRAVVISYHSLEDRLVKESFREKVKDEIFDVIPPNPLEPSGEEIKDNPRARSARLRAVIRRGARASSHKQVERRKP